MRNLVKMIMPVAAFVLASAGAVTTSNSNDSVTASTQGWRRIKVNDCVTPVMCNNLSANLCTTGAFQAYAKIGLDCTSVLYHDPTVSP